MARRGEGSVLLCDKPAGKTSHDVVLAVRRERGGKVGHAGTLDPFATGLLLVLIGRATRLQRFLTGLPKTYVAGARLGWRSSTGDPDGELSETGRIPASLELPTGTVRQRVPMTSAVRVGGERLYRKAHRGEVVETPEREVEVYRAELLGSDAGSAEYEIECSAGTYIRTLIETLDDAYCAELRRTAVGPFSVEDAGEELIWSGSPSWSRHGGGAAMSPSRLDGREHPGHLASRRRAATAPRRHRHLRRRPPRPPGRDRRAPTPSSPSTRIRSRSCTRRRCRS